MIRKLKSGEYFRRRRPCWLILASHGGGATNMNILCAIPNAIYMETSGPRKLVDGEVAAPEAPGMSSEVAEADIRKISPLRQLHLQQHMDGRARRINRQPAYDTPLQACDPIAERPKSGPE